ncbi:MAG: hypothetical protein PWQ76_640 [Clostridiales bacterium]|jgi:multimeric flavodoxin WrbA|nr:NADPH-dependent reductase [Oscillospiraceae bacterium]MDN5378385.1 hypothetical protein [Clostridiales bacterium]
MKIAAVYGFLRKGSTYNTAALLLESLKSKTECEISEFFLPKDMPNFCVGCFSCIMNSEEKCPHYAALQPIAKALDEADVIILASPVYVFDVSGQMKAFLDHFGYRWMLHRPSPAMFSKIGVAISTTAGSGQKRTNETMAKSLSFWGTRKIFSYGKAVRATSWDGVSPEMKENIKSDMEKLSQKIIREHKKHKRNPEIKTRLMFHIFRKLNKMSGWNKADKEYWEAQGWLGSKRPWN